MFLVLKSIELDKYSDPIEEEKKKERMKPSVERKNTPNEKKYNEFVKKLYKQKKFNKWVKSVNFIYIIAYFTQK
mgnify:CR=1 FL=1